MDILQALRWASAIMMMAPQDRRGSSHTGFDFYCVCVCKSHILEKGKFPWFDFGLIPRGNFAYVYSVFVPKLFAEHKYFTASWIDKPKKVLGPEAREGGMQIENRQMTETAAQST